MAVSLPIRGRPGFAPGHRPIHVDLQPIRGRAGFALPATLFVLAFVAGLAASIHSTATFTIQATRNRMERERAFWHAAGCEHRVRASVDRRLKEATTEMARRLVWATLSTISRETADDGCRVTLEAAGTRVDVNSAPRIMLVRAMQLVLPDLDADVLVDSLVEQRDSSSIVELRDALLRADPSLSDGILDSLATILSTTPGRLSLTTASATTLAALPGFTSETADVLVRRRATSGPLTDLAELLPHLSRRAADLLIADYPEAQRLSTPVPDAWTVRVSMSTRASAIGGALEWRLARVDDATDLVRAMWLP